MLIDSTAAIIETYQNILQKLGYQVPPTRQIEESVHLPFREAIQRLLGRPLEGNEYGIFLDALRAPEYRATDKIKPHEDAERLLRKLQPDYILALATNRSRLGMSDIFGVVGIKIFFKLLSLQMM